MKIFISGATGVIGRRVVPQLVTAGHHVSAMVRSQQKELALENAGARTLVVDLFDPKALHAAVAGHDVVINLATHMPASTSRMLLPGAWRENDRIRRVASANLVGAAIAGGIGRFIQESFAPAYPDGGDAWIDEDTPIAPARRNRSIIDAESAASRYTATGHAGVVLRFARFYGPDSIFVCDMIETVRKGWVPLPGSPDAYFSSISHDDAASAVIAALGVPAGTYNVVDNEPLRGRDFAGALAAALEVASPRPLPAWLSTLARPVGKSVSRSQRISNIKLRWASGWKPKYPSVREGWPATVAAMQRADPPIVDGQSFSTSFR